MLNKSKQSELERLVYFSPGLRHRALSTNDIDAYFAYSEHGIRPAVESEDYKRLLLAKQLQGRTVHELYEPGILDGSMPYAVILNGAPRSVIDFLKKEMFKGADSVIIEEIYETRSELPKQIQ